MANPPLSTLQDPFTGSTISPTRWGNSSAGASTLDTVNGLVMLAVGTGAFAFNGLGSNGPYDATGSSLYAQITVPPVGNGGALIQLKLDAGSSNAVSIQAKSGGSFLLQLTTAGTTVNTTLPAYDPHAHRWWRISETGGTFTAAASPDGYNWTSLGSASYAWNATACAVYFQTGTGASTEPSGMVATISHVNTMNGGPFNINWPVLEDAWGAHWNSNGGDSPLDRYVDLTARTRQQSTVNRGRQYELDQVRAGDASLSLENKNGSLDPVNASGPYAGHIVPYQPYRKRAQWPPSRNLLTQVQATGGDLGGQPLGGINGGNSGPSIFTNTDSGGGSFVSSATAWQGGTTMQFAVTTAATTASRIAYTPQPAVAPGTTYTQSAQVRNVTASTTVQVRATLVWLDATQAIISTSAGTPVTLTGSATAGWSPITVTGTAPANAAMVYVAVQPSAVPAANCSVQVDGWQLERAAVGSAWACPGAWFPIYAGFMERWPSSWDMGGTYGTVQPTAVDAMALLSQKVLSDPLTQEIANNNPRFHFKLDDPAGSTSAADATGNYPAAQIGIAKGGAGTLTFGNAITSASPTGGYTGSTGTVVTLNNPSPGVNAYVASSFLSLDKAGIVGPANPSGSWTRMLAFRYTGPTPSYNAYLWTCMDGQHTTGAPTGSQLYWLIDNTGKLSIQMSGPTGGLAAFVLSPNVVDSNWHLAIASYSHANTQLIINLDGTNNFWPSINPAWEPTGLDSDKLGAYVDIQSGNYSTGNYKGDISFAAEFPTALSGNDMVSLYTAWRNSFAGDSTNTRYGRILKYAGYTGPQSLQTGLTTSMGPAALDGQDALSALQAVVDSENGAHFVDRAGTVTFRSRSNRYNALTPAYVFGERADLGEWPYEDAQLDYDPTHLANFITLTQASTNQTFVAQDATSQKNYFPRSLQRTVNSNSALEMQDAANYLLSRYKNPATRVSTLLLHPSAQPALWPVCLALELGTRVRVMRRPPAPAPPITVDCFVENIQVTTTNTGDATWILQCSPVDLTPYAVFAAWHTTLKTTVASGVGSITVNASADTVNPLAAQIGPGQQIVLGQGTANAETVTVLSVGATSSGWTSAVITLTANTAKGHTAGDSICEPLPAGITDPTIYDTVSAFDAVAFAY